MNICKHCGTEMKDVLASCPSCGERGAVLYNYTVPVEKAADARKNMMSKWLKTEGRCRRNEFWKGGLLNTLYIFGLIALTIALVWIMWTPTLDGIYATAKTKDLTWSQIIFDYSTDLDICAFIVLICIVPLILFFLCKTIIAQITMTVRRLHDLGKSGLLLMVSALPAVAYVVMQVCVLVGIPTVCCPWTLPLVIK